MSYQDEGSLVYGNNRISNALINLAACCAYVLCTVCGVLLLVNWTNHLFTGFLYATPYTYFWIFVVGGVISYFNLY